MTASANNDDLAHLETNGAQEYAAFDIHGRLVEIDDAEYESYKTFEIEFETQPSMIYIPSFDSSRNR